MELTSSEYRAEYRRAVRTRMAEGPDHADRAERGAITRQVEVNPVEGDPDERRGVAASSRVGFVIHVRNARRYGGVVAAGG